jgi:hypothetical protein
VITRIEIDGFKSFVDFELDIPRFLVIAGSNGSGKSNLLDALELARLAVEEGPAVALLDGDRGKADELFHRRIDGTLARSMRMRLGFADADGRDRSWGFEVERPEPRAGCEAVARALVGAECDARSGAGARPWPVGPGWLELGGGPWPAFRGCGSVL